MKSLSMLALGLALFALPTLATADEPKKDDTVAKLLGKWEVTKATDEFLIGATVIFEKEGKITIILKVNNEEMKVEGTYKVEKDKLITSAGGDMDTDTIKKLTADAMELENGDKKVTVLKKKK